MDITATNYQLNMGNFDLTVFNHGGSFEGHEGTTAAYYNANYNGYSVALNGSGFEFNDPDHPDMPTGGIVHGINIIDYSGTGPNYPDLSIAGLSAGGKPDSGISVAALYKFTSTESAKDDHAALKALLGGKDSIVGAQFGDTLKGYDGNDLLDGGRGNDTLTGGADKDTFVFAAKLGSSNVDTITDFNHSDDTIDLDHLIFKKVDSVHNKTVMVESEFYVDKKHVHGNGDAKDKGDHIIYNYKNGFLSYDSDGSGKHDSVHFATVDAHLSNLSASDFHLI